MKNFSTAIVLGLFLIVFAGCSSAPEGAVSIKELQRTIEQRIGQEVVVVGTADLSNASMSSFRLLRLFRGNDAVWASIPEDATSPPQGMRVRVTGVVTEEEFPGGVGRRVYVKSRSIRIE